MKMNVKCLIVPIVAMTLLSTYWLCICMGDLTLEEWESIAKSEAQERGVQEQEERELQEALRLSLEQEQKRQAQETELKSKEAEKQVRIQAEKELKPTLPPLTDEQMAAGVSGSKFYDPNIDFPKLHAEGNVIDKRFLADIFFHSMFQYYTYDFLGFNMTFDYRRAAASRLHQDMAAKFRTLIIGQARTFSEYQLRETIIPPLESIESVVAALKSNNLLQRLGIAYMRQKIVTEKLVSLVEKGREDIKRLLEHDRYAIDLQTMIYHMMEEAYESYAKAVRIAQKEQKPVADGKFLASFEPSFVNEPYYARIIAKLEELSGPMHL